MFKQYSLFHAIMCVLWALTTASATTVTFDIQPQQGDASQEIVVAPGDVVAYEITALVTSDDAETPDHRGLSSFSLDVLTDLGVVQDPVDELDADIAAVFTLNPTLGQSSGDDILNIGASQDVVLGEGAITLDIASGTAQVLARGELITPTTEGTFTITISTESEATVFASWNTSEMMLATTAVGNGMTIRTDSTAVENTGSDTTGDSTSDSGTNTDSSTNTDTSTNIAAENPVFASTLALTGVAILVAGALALFGPVVSGVVLVLALTLITFLSSLSGL